jgi:hypothetical protein
LAGKTLDLLNFIVPDQLGCSIANFYVDWDRRRQKKIDAWKEVQQYIYATDTTQTSNSKLPWNNKTTLPKLCQIRDNLYANYIATMFPKRKWLIWEGDDQASQVKDKKDTIESYMAWVIDRTSFKKEINKLVLDYIDYGNCFATVEWVDGTVELPDRSQVGFVGPMLRRVNPVDIVFNPIAPTFDESPKIIRSLVSLGEVKKFLQKEVRDPDELKEVMGIYDYLKKYRTELTAGSQSSTELLTKDELYNIAGFTDFRGYLQSNYVEVLTFYGDLYDPEKDELLENHVITVVDRHKVLTKKPNPSFFGSAPIYHSGWRVRQDNLWAMGPLDNLVGMQYRIDHLENLKADVFDLIAFPPLKIKGYVEDFKWGPFEQIVVGDEGDVEVMSPAVQALNADMQIERLEEKMEEIAGAPKEAMGFRTPGEKTMYEVQRLENAAARIFQNKVAQFEQTMVEPLLNAMLEMARRKMSSQTIRVFDNEFEVIQFQELTKNDITGNGRIKPIAAQHFAERANQIQNITNFFQTLVQADPDIKLHWSSIKLAKLTEDLMDLDSQDLVEPFVRLSEQADAQRLMAAHSEQLAVEGSIRPGLFPEDSEEPFSTDGGATNSMALPPPGPGGAGAV